MEIQSQNYVHLATTIVLHVLILIIPIALHARILFITMLIQQHVIQFAPMVFGNNLLIICVSSAKQIVLLVMLQKLIVCHV